MRIAYIDCPSGVAGDMLFGALLDAGADLDEVRNTLESLDVADWDLQIAEVERTGLRAKKVTVVTTGVSGSRDYAAVKQVLATSALPDNVRDRAERTFHILATAEAAVHGVDIDRVHFHEVGAIDALIDVVGCCAAIESLSLELIVASALPSGSGTIATEHGVVPVPAPAVVEILRGVPIHGAGSGELVTPTGAALLVANADSFGPLPSMQIESVGYGAGDRETETANLTRVFIGETISVEGSTHLLVETNVDDMSPELIPYAIERLIASGADDAWANAITMKKGRPAFTISALCDDSHKAAVLDTMFRETTTFGARIQRVEKSALTREWIEVEVAGSPVRVKVAKRGGEVVTAAPEHDDAVKVARATGLALKDVYAEALKAYDAIRAGQNLS